MEINVIKKDGTLEEWCFDKIKVAIDKATKRANAKYPKWKIWQIEGYIEGILFNKAEVTSEALHGHVIDALNRYLPEVGKAYQEYRDYKNTYAKAFESVKDEADTVLLLGDRENANFDSSLISTKGSLIKGYLTKELFKQFYFRMLRRPTIMPLRNISSNATWSMMNPVQWLWGISGVNLNKASSPLY